MDLNVKRIVFNRFHIWTYNFFTYDRFHNYEFQPEFQEWLNTLNRYKSYTEIIWCGAHWGFTNIILELSDEDHFEFNIKWM